MTGSDSVPLTADPRHGTRLGPYRLLHEIGRGGMGTVYLAVRADDVFEKQVAVKILKRGMDTEAIAARFRNERQILASLDHPNIAGLIDGGTTPDGLPYFAMEYVEGRQLGQYCDANGLDTAARLDLFREVCSAVQYAHQNLIIHRDIKPANVLVTADGVPKLLDFGIAKLLDPAFGAATHAATIAGQQLMTPEYASPEQVRGEAVTTATDVYSLGVLLYELLTGRRPYRITSHAPAEIARVVCEAIPQKPSTAVTEARAPLADADAATQAAPEPGPATEAGFHEHAREVGTERLRKRLAGDLDTIVLKALSKEPARRYASVDQFSEDIRRHLAGLPVIARRDTFGYRTAKFVRRHRAAVVAAGLTFVALIAGVVGTTWQAREARRARARAEARFDDVRQLANSFLFEIHDAIRDLPGSTPARRLVVAKALEFLDRLAREAGDREDVRRDLAEAYGRVGDVQGRPFTPNLGDTSGALESYRRAAAIYEGLGAATSPDPALRRGLGSTYVRLSDVLAPMGQTAEALESARKGLALLDPVTDGTAPADARRALAVSHSRVGDMLSASGDTRGAIAERRKALAMMEALVAEEPLNVDNLRQLGVSHQKLGSSLGNPNAPNIGDFAGAIEHFERAAGVARRGLAAHPDNTVFRRLLAVVASNTADVYQAQKDLPRAIAKQREALTLFTALAEADPADAAAQNDRAISFAKTGDVLRVGGREAEAVVEYQRALALHQKLSARDPEHQGLRLEIASDYNRLATSQAALGQRGPSLSNHDYAVSMSRAISALNPANSELRLAVALALASRGDAYAAFARRRVPGATLVQDLTSALRDYSEAGTVLEDLHAKGAIQGTDVATLENARQELARLRAELAAAKR